VQILALCFIRGGALTLRFWINAFIPSYVAGYTINITSGANAGKSAIPLPGAARVNPGNLFKAWNAGFLTDQRGFDSNPGASVRMRSWAEIDVAPGRFSLIDAQHETSGTTEVDTSSGATIDTAPADMSRCRWGALTDVTPVTPITAGSVRVPFGGSAPIVVGVRPTSVATFAMTLTAAAGDPLVYTAADIDYEGTFTITLNPSAPTAITLAFQGKLDAFPAFEAYAQFNGTTKTVFVAPPPLGNTVMNLAGYANRPISGTVSFP